MKKCYQYKKYSPCFFVCFLGKLKWSRDIFRLTTNHVKQPRWRHIRHHTGRVNQQFSRFSRSTLLTLIDFLPFVMTPLSALDQRCSLLRILKAPIPFAIVWLANGHTNIRRQITDETLWLIYYLRQKIYTSPSLDSSVRDTWTKYREKLGSVFDFGRHHPRVWSAPPYPSLSPELATLSILPEPAVVNLVTSTQQWRSPASFALWPRLAQPTLSVRRWSHDMRCSGGRQTLLPCDWGLGGGVLQAKSEAWEAMRSYKWCLVYGVVLFVVPVGFALVLVLWSDIQVAGCANAVRHFSLCMQKQPFMRSRCLDSHTAIGHITSSLNGVAPVV